MTQFKQSKNHNYEDFDSSMTNTKSKGAGKS